jgi:hypothetical protein
MLPKMKLLRIITLTALAAQAAALAIGGKEMIVERDSDGLQNIVSIPNLSQCPRSSYQPSGDTRLRTKLIF